MSRIRPLPALTALLATGLVLTSAACSPAAEHTGADKPATPTPAAATGLGRLPATYFAAGVELGLRGLVRR